MALTQAQVQGATAVEVDREAMTVAAKVAQAQTARVVKEIPANTMMTIE